MRQRHAVAAIIVTVGMLAGCSSDGEDAAPAPETPATTTSEATDTSSETPTAAPGSVDVSPGGVTTAVGAPAESTEEEYSKACITAKAWMDQQGGDPKSQIEPYLGMLQSTDSAGPGTYGTPWSQLSPERQAAVIVAVRAAADELCG
ncbi:lipoprotein LpqV [Mycobacterium sp. IDR2000157661]|uniref:lipoprotein LpqV n=1 Tax=Mycobacterium sp. IDR2000157661 TaxID=2867005 RepID=UPI001EEC5957|nr:lipoprotein LpqV [Mycobacterium sp. IDR2000157661]ULE31353.1 lipoprotein LpqV [Mycobacterium sp. IDR2000157661]